MGKRTELIKQLNILSDDKLEIIYKKINREFAKLNSDNKKKDLSEFFGIFNWNIDSVDYQRNLRNEWD